MFTGYIAYNGGNKVLTLKTPSHRKGDVNFLRLLKTAVTRDTIAAVEFTTEGQMLNLKLHTSKSAPLEEALYASAV
jgi:hypothetical protein